MYLPANIESLAISSSKEQLFYDAVRSEASGDYETAIQNYKEALLQSSTANLHGNLANLYYKTNDYGRSVLHYKKALCLDQNNREFLSNLAYVSKIAQVDITNQLSPGFLNGFSNNFWKGFSAIFFWFGLRYSLCFSLDFEIKLSSSFSRLDIGYPFAFFHYAIS